ncbi:hypothetical protein, partial [Klebsiella pneumoniae]|uniref:hypothetical protein n=1 Tax=Klebsiella pneumoniae TaxID=573 RepID=UPI0027D8D975
TRSPAGAIQFEAKDAPEIIPDPFNPEKKRKPTMLVTDLTLRFQRRGFRLGADVAGFCGAVGFAQRMAAGDQRDDLFIVHR